MSTPEKPRPPLADTIARIDAALAEPPILPMVGGVYLHSLQLQVRRPLGMQDLADIERVLNEPPSPESAPPDPDWVTVEKLGHLPGPPGPTCPGCEAEADAARPGLLARVLNRLFP